MSADAYTLPRGYDVAAWRAAELVEAVVGPAWVEGAVVGGVLFDRDADDLLSYMVEVDDAINRFNADVGEAKGLPPIYVTAWSIFIAGRDDLGGVIPPVPGSVNWREFFDDNSGSWARTSRTDQIWQATADYELKLIQFRAKFRELGHSPKSPEPVAGWDKPPDDTPQGKIGDALQTVALLGLLFAGGYILHGVAKMGGRS